MTRINATPHGAALKGRVLLLLQEAEEINGLDLGEYVRVMEEIAEECRERSLRARELTEATSTTQPRELDACGGGIKAFSKVFPDGLDVSRWDASCQLGVLMHPELRKYLGWAWENEVVPLLPMAGWDLTRADLSGANLLRANLLRANLTGANLYGANLYGANLRGADLRRTNLTGADLTGTDLRGADLSGAWLRWADLYRADLREANLYGANLYRADLREASLYGANLLGVDLSEADLQGARWRFRDRPTDLNVNEEWKQER